MPRVPLGGSLKKQVERSRKRKKKGGSISTGPSLSRPSRSSPSSKGPSSKGPQVSGGQGSLSSPANANFSSVDGAAQFVPPPDFVAQENADAIFQQATRQSQPFSQRLAQQAIAQQPQQNQSLMSKAGEAIRQRIGEEIFAVTGIEGVGGFTPNPNVTYSVAAAPAKLTATRIAGSQVAKAVNPKGAKVAAGMFSKYMTKQNAITAAVAGWAGSVVLGQWGNTEKTDGADIYLRDLQQQAYRTNDPAAWAQYNEFISQRDEMRDTPLWQEIALWSPISAPVGIHNRNEGVLLGHDVQRYTGQVMQQYSQDNANNPNANPSNDPAFWAQRDKDKFEMEKELQDRYLEINKQLTQWKIDAEQDADREAAAFWAEQQEFNRKQEAAERERIAKFWLEFRKQIMKLNESTRPSNLKFGLL